MEYEHRFCSGFPQFSSIQNVSRLLRLAQIINISLAWVLFVFDMQHYMKLKPSERTLGLLEQTNTCAHPFLGLLASECSIRLRKISRQTFFYSRLFLHTNLLEFHCSLCFGATEISPNLTCTQAVSLYSVPSPFIQLWKEAVEIADKPMENPAHGSCPQKPIDRAPPEGWIASSASVAVRV